MKPSLAWTPPRWGHRGSGEVVILDNRDSFVFNLAHRLVELGWSSIAVVRSDRIDVETLLGWRPAALILSPGPGHPQEAGCSVEAVRAFSGRVPVLGICLGHQAIVEAFGGRVEAQGVPVHGMASPISHDGQGLFEGLPQGFEAARYHSLVAREPLPHDLLRSAWWQDTIMAVRHRHEPTFGLQFHPESILSPSGYHLLGRFLDRLER